MKALEICIAFLMLFAAMACRSEPKPQPPSASQQIISWRKIGSWSGHGNTQTESFDVATGSLRVRWTAKETQPGGVFRLTFNSAISGRPLSVAVDHQGGGSDTTFVDQDPHTFYAVVDSNEDWSFTVEEAVAGTLPPAKSRSN